jgi:hypothetical protein
MWALGRGNDREEKRNLGIYVAEYLVDLLNSSLMPKF